ncbi:NUDIX domain-containing protein [Acidovorax sp. sif1233]|uniref:NUDIX hydrolase n=1 Tax=unclassified Acidovorax TaxID=2684926 RepID=UPI001C48DBEC|nr:NUDIX domain-containing protein [Acidovorax sp. sif0732]MBV7449784.1 NUDIX domain-containing protein [Acidovorax sp. sif0715]MBV7455615.1 NUDIX domain-containing protein [Acidovorax sp. sif1233]
MSAAHGSTPFGHWLAGARQAARQPAAQSRQALLAAGQVVGSVAEGFLEQIGASRAIDKRFELSKTEHQGAPAWHLQSPPGGATEALNALAAVLRGAGRCGPWRNEQLAVCNPQGDVVATVERGAVRVLGIATRAVHLVGLAPDGRMWVQKRALTKPNNPGLWDTLMGGMVAAADTLPQALARETWEEAGLRIEALAGVAHGGHVLFSRPSREGGGVGFMVERIDWFRAQVPDGLEPCNQDGEVERFDLLSLDSLREQVAQGAFTLEAGLVIAGFLGA